MSRRPPLWCSEHALSRWALRTGRDPTELADAWYDAVFVGQGVGHRGRHLFGYQVGSVVLVVRYFAPSRGHPQHWEALSVWHWDHWQRWRDRTERSLGQ